MRGKISAWRWNGKRCSDMDASALFGNDSQGENGAPPGSHGEGGHLGKSHILTISHLFAGAIFRFFPTADQTQVPGYLPVAICLRRGVTLSSTHIAIVCGF